MASGLRPKRSLFWRVYLQGVLLLIVVATAVGVTVALVGGRPGRDWDMPERAAAFIVADLGKLDGVERQARIDELARIFDVDVAIYERADNTLVASAGARVPDPLRAHEWKKHEGGSAHHHYVYRRDAWLFVVPLDEGSYLVSAHEAQHKGWGKFIGTILAISLAVALVSMPFTRAITRPLERLTLTARALGEGNLDARSGIQRKDEVGLLAEAFDDMARRIQALLTAERELLANVSHEIRTPMARIRVALELADEEKDAEAARQRLIGISQDIAELEALLENVLTASRLDLAGQGGRIPLSRREVQIEDVLAESLRRFARIHPQRALSLDADEALSPVEADPTLLRRVVDNLLDNAAKYAPDDTAIELAAARNGRGVQVEVRDRGEGVAAEDLPRLFDPFFRADRSRNRETGGVGLGLSLCRRIVEAHGGEIRAEPRDGGGTTFLFTIPAR